MTLVAVIIAVAGFCLILGARKTAVRFLKLAGVLTLVLILLPCLRLKEGAGIPWESTGQTVPLLVSLALAVVGYVAWRLRPATKRAQEVWRKRHLHPRRRAIPLPPPAEEDEP